MKRAVVIQRGPGTGRRGVLDTETHMVQWPDGPKMLLGTLAGSVRVFDRYTQIYSQGGHIVRIFPEDLV